MTLLELLRQELPKRGGWPEGADYAVQDGDGTNDIKFGAGEPSVLYECDKVWRALDWGIDTVESYIYGIATLASDHATAIVTREQYGATGWDGTGLPPVGCTCESSWAGDEWQLCEILFASNQFVVVKLKESSVEDAYSVGDVTFRPLRTEAERAIDEMVRLSGVSIGAAKILYDAGYRK